MHINLIAFFYFTIYFLILESKVVKSTFNQNETRFRKCV